MHCSAALTEPMARFQVQAHRAEGMARWDDVVRYRAALLETLSAPESQAEQLHFIGAAQGEHLADVEAAQTSLNRALDLDPSRLQAFEALDRILAGSGDHAAQAEAYERMLERAAASGAADNVVVTLARNLGDLLMTQLNDEEKAGAAYGKVLELRPDDAATHRALAQIHSKEGGRGRAIQHHRRAIDLEPNCFESYQALRHLFFAEKQYDAGWCLCRVLTVLGQASSEEVDFYERYATSTPTRAERALQQAHWSLIDHNQQSQLLNALFERIFDTISSVMAVSARKLGLKRRRDFIDLSATSRFTNVVGYLLDHLPVPHAEIYRSTQIRGMRPALLEPPVMLVNPAIMDHDLFTMAFVSGRYLSMLRPAHLVVSSFADAETRQNCAQKVVDTVRCLVDRKKSLPHRDDQLTEALGHNLSKSELKSLSKLVAKMELEPEAHFDVARWLRCVDFTGDRIGFIFANNLEKPLNLIRVEDPKASVATVAERLDALVSFAFSDEYMQVRRLIGHNID
jgi:tetratricopeptide (TPR) repeat protein